MTEKERFYSGKASGEVTVREAGSTRMLGRDGETFTWGRVETGAEHLALRC